MLPVFGRPFRALKWFPDAYYGNEDSGGVRGHYYHVFDTDHPLCVLRLRYDTHQVTLVQQ
jgi:hypothetical protein